MPFSSVLGGGGRRTPGERPAPPVWTVQSGEGGQKGLLATAGECVHLGLDIEDPYDGGSSTSAGPLVPLLFA